MAAWGLLLRRNYNTGLRKWAYNLSGFNKYGLYHDDVLDEEDQDVAEAVRRLPEDLRNGRTFRIVRALQLSLEHDILPKEEWTNFEDVCMQGVFQALYFNYASIYLKLFDTFIM